MFVILEFEFLFIWISVQNLSWRMNILTDIVYNVDELKECTFNLNMVRANFQVSCVGLSYILSVISFS